MAVTKHISIHSAPKAFLEYILDKEKNKDLKYVSEQNCSVNVNEAYEIYRNLFEQNEREPFIIKGKSKSDGDTSKQKVRIHHYIQSFDPDDNDRLTPEEVNRIGMEWAKECFGEKAVIVVSTHVDKKHYHNHISVSPFSIDGKRIVIDNQKTLKQYKKISDKLCEKYGLSWIKNPQSKNSMKHNEWEARKTGMSWKQKLCDRIDGIIPNVNSVEELKAALEKEGYKVRTGRYMTVTLPKGKKAIRTNRLGQEYELENIRYRITNKEKEIDKAEFEKYSGIGKVYAMYYQKIQICVFRTNRKKSKKEWEYNYNDAKRTLDVLNFMSQNNVTSVIDLERMLSKADEEYNIRKGEMERIRRRYYSVNRNEDSYEKDAILNDLKRDMLAAETKFKESSEHRSYINGIYKGYLELTKSSVYLQIQDELAREAMQKNADEMERRLEEVKQELGYREENDQLANRKSSVKNNEAR